VSNIFEDKQKIRQFSRNDCLNKNQDTSRKLSIYYEAKRKLSQNSLDRSCRQCLLNFKSLHFSRNFKLILVAFSISLPIFDPGMSFSVNYIDKNNILISLNTSQYCVQESRCTQSLSSLMTIRPLCMITEPPVYCCLQLDWAILMIRLMNLRNKKEKLYFLATKYMY
jgi:hypothetical protein